MMTRRAGPAAAIVGRFCRFFVAVVFVGVIVVVGSSGEKVPLTRGGATAMVERLPAATTRLTWGYSPDQIVKEMFSAPSDERKREEAMTPSRRKKTMKRQKEKKKEEEESPVFNHDTPGMTYPRTASLLLHHSCATPEQKERKKKKNDKVSTSTQNRAKSAITLPWWPGLRLSVMEQENKDTATKCRNQQKKSQWRILRFRHCFSAMDEKEAHAIYHRVKKAALRWEFSALAARRQRRLGIVRYSNPTPYLATYTEIPHPWKWFLQLWTAAVGLNGRLHQPLKEESGGHFILSPVAVVYNVVDQCFPNSNILYTCTAYGTLQSHLLCGEERVTVLYHRQEAQVDVEILSLSKSTPSLMGRLVWIMMGGLQKQFFETQLRHLIHVGENFHPTRRKAT